MLLFDLDGTLIDSNGIWTDIDIRFLSRRGLEVTQEYLYAVSPSIVPLAAVFTRDYYHLDMTPEAIVDEWMEGALDAYRNVAPKPGALAFLEQCRDRGEDMALVTACDPGLCRAALERHGLSPFFRAVVYAQELGLAFQIRDDMLDVCGDAEEFGKPIGSDKEEGKVTFVDLLGLSGCDRAVRAHTEAAKAAVADFDADGFLAALADSLAERNK